MKNTLKQFISSNKKIALTLFVLIVGILLVWIFTGNDLSIFNNSTNDSNLEYINESLGYSITLPQSVKDRVTIKTSNRNKDTIYISSKMILENDNEWLGIILFINPYSKSQYTTREELDDFIQNEAPVTLRVIGETEDNYICYSFASDVNYPPENETLKQEYNDLKNEFMEKGFKFKTLK